MKTAKNLRIVYMGTPEFAVAPLAALIDGGYNVVGVVTVPDKPAGRGRKLSQSAVKQYVTSLQSQNDGADQNHTESQKNDSQNHVGSLYPKIQRVPALLQPDKLRDEQWLSDLKALNADLFIVVAFRMLPEIVWQMPPLGTFNLHSSLLPLYRGAAPINWAIINGDTKTGVTTFFINAEIDKGAIIAQREVAITPEDCAGTLHDKLMNIGAELVMDSVQKIADGNVTPLPQPTVDDTLRSAAPKIFKDDCRIDWGGTCKDICNKIRGLSPYPAAWAEFGGTQSGDHFGNLPERSADDIGEAFTAKILAAHGEVAATGVDCGSMDSDFKRYFRVGCADGWVYIDTIHPAGKRPMLIADFLRGARHTGNF